MKIRWITPMLGTAAASAVQDVSDIRIIDVRDLVDKAGNRSEAIREKIREGVESLSQGLRTVVCCDYGVSRSNAIATGILARFEKKPFNVVLRQVQEATGESQIKLEPLKAVRDALDEGPTRIQKITQQCVLVTGGSGFLGKVLITRLGDEFRVVAPGRKELDISLGSTQIELLSKEEDIDCVVHLANPRVYTSNVAMGLSLTMLRNVIDVCLANEVPLIYLSSWEIYSGYVGTLRVDESTPALPRGSYGETKYLAELLIEHCRRAGGLRCALLRSSPVFGAGGDKPKFIHNFIEKAQRAQTIVTHRYKNGDPALDLLYVDDLVSALVAVITTGFTGDLNLGTGILTSTREIAQMLRAMLGSVSQIEQTSIDSNVASIAMDWRRAQTELDWRPTVPLDSGLRRVLLKLEINENNDEYSK